MAQKYYPDSIELDRTVKFNSDYVNFLFDHINVKPDMIIVEPGCGTSFFIRKMAGIKYGFLSRLLRKIKKKNRIIGIDCDSKILHYGKEFVKAQGLSSIIDLLVGDAYNMSLPDESADLVFSHLFLCNIKDPLKAIREMVRITKKNGTVIAVEPYNSGNIYYEPNNEEYTRLQQKANTHYIEGYMNLYGGDLDIGPKIPSLFLESGLTDIELYTYLSTFLPCDVRIPKPTRLLTQEEINRIMKSNEETFKEDKEVYIAGRLSPSDIEKMFNYESERIQKALREGLNYKPGPSVTSFPNYLTIGKKM